MQDFNNYLVSRHFTSKKESHFYRLWVKNLYEFIGKNPGSKLENEDIDKYINYITKSKQEWQVRQAQEAIRIYVYYKNQQKEVPLSVDSNIKAQWKIVGSEMMNMLRLKQLSLQAVERMYQTAGKGYRF